MTALNSPLSNSLMALASLDQAAMDAFPEAVYLCAGNGGILRFNQKPVELWGRTATVGERQSGSATVSGFIEWMAAWCFRIGAPWLSRCRRAGAFATRRS